MIRIVLLGIIQGLTEFLPVSSSGHLLLFEKLFWNGAAQSSGWLNLLLHGGTLVAVCILYRKTLWGLFVAAAKGIASLFVALFGKNKRAVRECASRYHGEYAKIGLLAVASVPAAVVGIFAEDWVERTLGNGKVLWLCFMVTAILLLVSDRTRGQGKIGFWTAVGMGIGQAFAVLPGLSRSGTTIAMALILGAGREESTEFSFLMSIPVILGGIVFALPQAAGGDTGVGVAVVGMVAAAVFGIVALKAVQKLTLGKKNYLFAIYLLVLSAVCAILSAYNIL